MSASDYARNQPVRPFRIQQTQFAWSGGDVHGRRSHRVLHQIVVEHFETFRVQATSLRDGEGLPRFVEQEFRDFLTCLHPRMRKTVRLQVILNGLKS